MTIFRGHHTVPLVSDWPPCISAMLPVFHDKANTPQMIYHAMSTIKAATDHLNHGLTPVITLDQPLYAIAKAIQWNPTTRFNEDNFFVFLGPRHSEMLCENVLGDWVRDSGWVEIRIDADVTSPGRADALIKGAHVTRSHYAHQVRALSFSILRKDAHTRYRAVCEENGAELISYKTWCVQQGSKIRQFKYWQTVYDTEMRLLRCVRSIRTGDLFLDEKSLD